MCTRMLVAAGVMEYSGHVSARLAEGDRFLIQRVADVRAELEPDRLLVVDLDGRVLEGDGKPPSELFIHSEIYKRREDVGAVVHFHHDRTTLFSLVQGLELVPVKNHAARWATGIPVHHNAAHIDTPALGAALALTLGSANGALLRAHGEVVVAEDVPTLFADAVHFVENADTLAQATVLGTVLPLDKDETEAFLSTFDRQHHAEKLWAYYAASAAHAGVIPESWA